MPARKRLYVFFLKKANILEEYLNPNFDKEKICKEYGIGKPCLYDILKEKDTNLSMNFKKSNASSRKFAKSLSDDFENELKMIFVLAFKIFQ